MDAGGSRAPLSRRRGSTRGFLFADLRGYTAFLEKRGADDAAVLLDRYRHLVRAAVATHDGAEIRTEGDSFYVVFPDASGAVACGLAIALAADEATAASPTLPIRVGIGVHAGETVETAEGYVGSAVNLAARLCAAAPAGEVLVSDTVRALTAGVAPVRYESRGRRRFKGIGEPVGVYRALGADQEVTAARSRPWPVVLGAAALLSVGVLAVALIGGALTREGLGSGGATTSPAPASATFPSPTPPRAEPSASRVVANRDEDLLALVDPRYHATCQHTSEREIPRYVETRNEVTGPNSWPIPIAGGIVCAPFGLDAPDQLGLWEVAQTGTLSGLNETDVIHNLAGTRDADRGSCGEEAPALEAWASGPLSGHLLCLAGSDAVVYWSYAGSGVIGRASRDDADLDALLTWWNREARLRNP